jgi:hypothetical protein
MEKDNDYECLLNSNGPGKEFFENEKWIFGDITSEYYDFLLNRVFEGHNLNESELFF